MRFRNRAQYDIDHAVATVTGEDLRVIRGRGFSLVNPDDQDFDPEPNLLAPQSIDWDELDLSRNSPVVDQRVRFPRRVA